MKINRLQLLPILALAFISTSCLDELVLEGNGHLIAEERHHINFDEVSSSGSFIVDVEEGDDFSVVVEAESNLLPYINTSVSHGNLSIWVQGVRILDNSLPMKVHITTPALSAVRLSGSGIIETDMFESPEFEVTISGSGRIYSGCDAGFTRINVSGSGQAIVDGWADDAEYVMSGSGKIDAYDLLLLDCKATISGSGHIFANANRMLDATISGSGNVYVLGNPHVRAHISGSGSIIREN